MNFEIHPLPTQRKVSPTSWKPPTDIRVISADDHNMEAEHLWEERLPDKFKNRAPKLWHDKSGWHLELRGRLLDTPGVDPDLAEGLTGMWSRDDRLRAMDAEGVSASLLYHARLQTLNILIKDEPDLYTACVDVYNEWLSEFTKPAAQRLFGVALLPTFLEPEASRDYLQKIADLGFKAMMMPSFPRGVRYNAKELDPLWRAIEDSQIPLSFHITATLEFMGRGSLGANIARNMSPFRPLLAQLMFSGVFERHPGLRVVFTEGGAAWVADALYGFDKVCRDYYESLRPRLAQLPSYYWKRQCYATFMDDPIAMDLIDRIGTDNVMWSLDYPHPEGVHGYAGEVAKNIYDSIGHERAKKVLGGNAASVWGI